jgi:hypothetical protein
MTAESHNARLTGSLKLSPAPAGHPGADRTANRPADPASTRLGKLPNFLLDKPRNL